MTDDGLSQAESVSAEEEEFSKTEEVFNFRRKTVKQVSLSASSIYTIDPPSAWFQPNGTVYVGHSVRKPPVLVHRASPSPENEECEDGPQQNRPQEEEEEEEEGDDVLFSYLVITPPAKRGKVQLSILFFLLLVDVVMLAIELKDSFQEEKDIVESIIFTVLYLGIDVLGVYGTVWLRFMSFFQVLLAGRLIVTLFLMNHKLQLLQLTNLLLIFVLSALHRQSLRVSWFRAIRQ